MNENKRPSSFGKTVYGFVVVAGGAFLALLCFLVLPLLQAITQREKADLDLRPASVAELPPPPELEEPPEQKKKSEDPPPELNDNAPPPDVSDLELLLNPAGLGVGSGDIAINIEGLLGGASGGVDNLFDMSSVDQKPRPVYRQQPRVTAQMRKRMPCTVFILCTVTADGRVENPIVQTSDDQLFDGPALAAIAKWKFEPARRGGEAVSRRIRQKMTFK